MAMQLLETPIELRDVTWEENFLNELPKSYFKLLFDDPKPGPDQWPYLFVQTGTESDEPALKVIEWLSTRGIGLAVNPQKTSPDYVFTYGMIWNFRETGKFLTPAPARESGSFKIEGGQQVLTGRPTEAYLPKYARTILKQFLLDQGIFAPKVMVVSVDHKNFDLSFSLESMGMPEEKNRKELAEALSWFLPAHYAISLISEKVLPGFEPL
jgi:hypothetical protein